MALTLIVVAYLCAAFVGPVATGQRKRFRSRHTAFSASSVRQSAVLLAILVVAAVVCVHAAGYSWLLGPLASSALGMMGLWTMRPHLSGPLRNGLDWYMAGHVPFVTALFLGSADCYGFLAFPLTAFYLCCGASLALLAGARVAVRAE